MKTNFKESVIFKKLSEESQRSVAKIKDKIMRRRGALETISLGSYVIEQIKREIGAILSPSFNLPSGVVKNLRLDAPPAHVAADLSVSLFDLARETGIDIKEISEKATAAINQSINSAPGLIESVQPVGPYLNLFLMKEKTYHLILSQINKLKDRYGESDINDKKIVLMDYSGPNIAKPFGVGHLRSTVIGQALANIYEFTGYVVIRDNHLGDWGTQFGKLIYAYQEWGDQKKIAGNPIQELNALYVRFHKEAEKNPEIEDMSREIFQKMEKGDEKLISLWSKFRKISVIEFKKVYKRLGIKFDTYIGESYFANETETIIKECLEKQMAKTDPETGAIVVEELGGLPSFLLRKKDDSGLYLTRDLAALIFRMKVFCPDNILYVVGEEQSLHFKQLFALASALKYLESDVPKHVSFGLVLSGGEKMSTRKGTLIELEGLINQSVEKSREILRQKNSGLTDEEVEEISEIIGLGAVIYNDLRQSRQKNISFDWKRMLDFEGASAVYLQYTVARINSILGKADEKIFFVKQSFVFEKESEFALARKMMFFPLIIIEAQRHDSPHLIAGYLEELAQLFNRFYNEISIISTSDDRLRLSRIILIKSTSAIIKKGLALLNIKTAKKI